MHMKANRFNTLVFQQAVFFAVILLGVIRGTGVYEPGKVKNTPAFGQAYEMGRSVR